MLFRDIGVWHRRKVSSGLLAAVLACAAAAALAPARETLAEGRGTILVYGDSLSAAYGIGRNESWVTLLGERLRRNGPDYTVTNASISGETTSGGAARIAGVLARERPALMVLALGANDGLRGLPVAQMRANLASIIAAARKAGARVLLVGMRVPPNYGPAYEKEFRESFPALASQHKLALVPFMLEGIAARRELFQDDQIHPTAAAQAAILENIWKGLRPMLGK